MQRLIGVLACSCIGLVTGCAASPDDVRGNEFECTGTWPSERTPCDAPVESTASTSARSDTRDVVTLTLRRLPSMREESMVVIELAFGVKNELSATAHEVTVGGDILPRVIETSQALSLSLDPVTVSRTPEGRNAGRFSITFEWGSISGTYDTDAAAP
jgi:hypothetical protein